MPDAPLAAPQPPTLRTQAALHPRPPEASAPVQAEERLEGCARPLRKHGRYGIQQMNGYGFMQYN